MYYDSRAIVQTLGCILNDPDLLVSGDYTLDIEDFPYRFHKIIFQTINYLYANGQAVTSIDIDNHISQYKEQYEEYKNNKGYEWLEASKDLASSESYNENCKTVKKFSLLRDAERERLNVKQLYDPENEDKVKKFYEMEIVDILNFFQNKVIKLEQKYSNIKEGIQAGEKLKERLEEFKLSPEMGLDCGINALNYFLYGLRKKYYLISSPTGYGKTRTLCRLACYSGIIKNEPTLFISTELEEVEIQAMVTAMISGVSERKIILNQCTPKEEAKVQRAVKFIEESNFHIVYMPDFDIQKIEYIMKKYILLHGVEYIFFDYIKASMSIISSMNKSAGGGLQVHQILTLLSERLKALSGKYDVGIYSATQLNASYFNKDGGGSSHAQLAGAKAIADSVDVGMILRPATQAEIDEFQLEFMIKDINNTDYQLLILDIYKNRRGLKDVSVVLNVNLGTLDYQEVCVIKNGKIINIPKVEFAS